MASWCRHARAVQLAWCCAGGSILVQQASAAGPATYQLRAVVRCVYVEHAVVAGQMGCEALLSAPLAG